MWPCAPYSYISQNRSSVESLGTLHFNLCPYVMCDALKISLKLKKIKKFEISRNAPQIPKF